VVSLFIDVLFYCFYYKLTYWYFVLLCLLSFSIPFLSFYYLCYLYLFGQCLWFSLLSVYTAALLLNPGYLLQFLLLGQVYNANNILNLHLLVTFLHMWILYLWCSLLYFGNNITECLNSDWDLLDKPGCDLDFLLLYNCIGGAPLGTSNREVSVFWRLVPGRSFAVWN
jgi:hypothetical protein